MKKFWILLTAILLLVACSQESYLPFINFDSAFDTKTRFKKKYQTNVQAIEGTSFDYLEFESAQRIGQAMDGSVNFISLPNITVAELEQLTLDFRLMDFDSTLLNQDWYLFESFDIAGVYMKVMDEQLYHVILIKDASLLDNPAFHELFKISFEESLTNPH
ncbi:hypothetical protein [Globicatella sanguinis]